LRDVKLKTLFVALFVSAVGGAAVEVAPAPTLIHFQTGPGRFEIAAVDAGAAKVATAAAEEAWRMMTEPLGLPEWFSTPILVRVVPGEEWREAAAFRVVAEPGAIVSLRVNANYLADVHILRRALVQSLLLRLAVAQHGVSDRIVTPLWLELAGENWWETHADPAQLDALKQASETAGTSGLAELLRWQRGGEEPFAKRQSAAWLLRFLVAESSKADEWPALLRRLLGGEEPLVALAGAFPNRFADATERELWWQTGYQQLRRTRTLPVLEIEESRERLQTLARFLAASGDGDRVVPWREVLAHGREPFVRAELNRRLSELNRLLPALHPFYRNAGLALADVFAGAGSSGQRSSELGARFEADWTEAEELRAASTQALDALERGSR
jgi:hypothetical protein